MAGVTLIQLHLHSTLQDLMLADSWIEIECPTHELLQRFEMDVTLPGVILQQQDEFVGMVSRQQFFERMSRPYSRDLFNHRPIQVLYAYVNQRILVLPGTTSIQVAARLSLERSLQLLYEPLVVDLGSVGYRLLDVHQLLLAQSQIHTLTLMALQDSQQALVHEKELAQITLHSIGDGVITTDAAGCLQSLNPVAERLTGWSLAQGLGRPIRQIFQLLHEESREPQPNPVEQVLAMSQTLPLTSHAILWAQHGSEFAIDYTVTLIQSPTGQIFGAVLVFRDVSQARDLARQLAWQASHDPLTQLVNRYQFDHCLQQAWQQAQVLDQTHALCCLDLDRFKPINDTCGHAAGDELLRQVSQLVQQSVRQSDVVARLGGDEFAILLYHCSLAQGFAIAQVIQHQIQAFCFTWEQHQFQIGVSIGVTTVAARSASPTLVLHEADAACYWAKRNGRNQVQTFAALASHG